MKKNILITGCSSGLGLALCEMFLEKGYRVYGLARRTTILNSENFIFKKCDLSDLQNINKNLEGFFSKIKEFEAVFLNAGSLGEINTLDKITSLQMQELMNINVYANKEILDLLKNKEIKNVLATSSGASHQALLGWSSYCLSKASLNMLIKLYSLEMPNSKLLSVAPGVINTAMRDKICTSVDENKFPAVKILKELQYFTPKQAALNFYKVLKKASEFESGSFLDVRDI